MKANKSTDIYLQGEFSWFISHCQQHARPVIIRTYNVFFSPLTLNSTKVLVQQTGHCLFASKGASLLFFAKCDLWGTSSIFSSLPWNLCSLLALMFPKNPFMWYLIAVMCLRSDAHYHLPSDPSFLCYFSAPLFKLCGWDIYPRRERHTASAVFVLLKKKKKS